MTSDEFIPEDGAVGNEGERATVGNWFGFWAHLSIYRFALPYAEGGRVLDVGAGTGYGAAYLARRGASQVRALEGSPDAVEHARHRYAGEPVTFEVADLNGPIPAEQGTYDLVFSSNVFEHVANVDGLAAECARIVAPGGTVIVAVPPICSPEALRGDIDNHFHVHHLPPTGWQAKLGRYFESVLTHAHHGAGAFADRAELLAEVARTDAEVTIREGDFQFPEEEAASMEREGATITAVFVCTGPRPVARPPCLDEETPRSWSQGALAAALLRDERARAARNAAESLRAAEQLRRDLDAARERERGIAAQLASLRAAEDERTASLTVDLASLRRTETEAAARIASLAAETAALRSSTSWVVTRPLRRLARVFRRG